MMVWWHFCTLLTLNMFVTMKTCTVDLSSISCVEHAALPYHYISIAYVSHLQSDETIMSITPSPLVFLRHASSWSQQPNWLSKMPGYHAEHMLLVESPCAPIIGGPLQECGSLTKGSIAQYCVQELHTIWHVNGTGRQQSEACMIRYEVYLWSSAIVPGA